jgi:hypothetical protein
VSIVNLPGERTHLAPTNVKTAGSPGSACGGGPGVPLQTPVVLICHRRAYTAAPASSLRLGAGPPGWFGVDAIPTSTPDLLIGTGHPGQAGAPSVENSPGQRAQQGPGRPHWPETLLGAYSA